AARGDPDRTRARRPDRRRATRSDSPAWEVNMSADPEQKKADAEAEPAKEALREAVRSVKTPEQAQQTIAAVKDAAEGVRAKQINQEQAAAPDPAQAAQTVQAAADTPGAAKAPATLLTAAREIAASDGVQREALEHAVQAAVNPEQHGGYDPALAES